MGMFDRVWLDCPKCFAKVEAQSKGGDCTLADYDAIDAPSNVLGDINDNHHCESCGYSFRTKVVCTLVYCGGMP